MSTGVHVIFGVGQVGSQLAKFLMDNGASVRVVKRSPRGVPDGAEGVFGDASDASLCRSAVEGARAVSGTCPALRPPVTAELTNPTPRASPGG